MCRNPSSLHNSLSLVVEVETTDTQEILGLKALLDSGASGLFLHIRFVREHSLTTRTLSRPILINNVDGTANAAGAITEVIDLVLRHDPWFTWLKEHNPEIDWAAGTVSMSHCLSRCQTCREEVKVERKARAKTRAAMRACRSSGIPTPEPELDDIPELYPDPDCDCDSDSDVSLEPDSTPSSDGADVMEEGFTNFYWRFICDFSHHARPLFDLMAKDVAWTWGSAQQDTFDNLKRAITSQPVLIFLDDDRPSESKPTART
ncbi:putative reverse transcriptase (RNA-dependent DNA polymerase) [Lyophyllum shimeji]|uniref:Reverse transcriptase (RNA-dependent DNA polymerase) n=1 Tax=Lyophyllum shimeji TaxID=47721 RepID=A0A9P3UXB1_LYOSH|nr:putative reverse transcriptase (RNA-dependent DNA polymerase) [Lyophyllum shimeji]